MKEVWPASVGWMRLQKKNVQLWFLFYKLIAFFSGSKSGPAQLHPPMAKMCILCMWKMKNNYWKIIVAIMCAAHFISHSSILGSRKYTFCYRCWIIFLIYFSPILFVVLLQTKNRKYIDKSWLFVLQLLICKG